MAEYYPLLARAVSSMRDSPVEKRRAIYDRARQALLDQLRSMQPAVPEEAILRESSALDEAVERIEAEMAQARAAGGAAAPTPPPIIVPPETPRAPPEASPPTGRKAAEPPASPPATPPVGAPSFEASATPPQAPRPPPPRPVAAPARPAPTTPARPAAEALQRIMADPGQAPPVIRASRAEDDDAEREANAARLSAALPSAPRLQVPSFDDAVTEAGARAAEGRPAEGDEAEPVQAPDRTAAREDGVRPAAPRPVTRERFNPRALILAAVGALVVLGIAYTAYRLRDKPEALARLRAQQIAAEQADAQKPGKVSNRADSGAAASAASTPSAPAASAAPAADAPAPAPAAPVTASEAPATPAPAAAEPSAAASSPPAGTAAPADQQPAQGTATAAPEGAAIPVAQRAAFLIDAPDDPQKVKTSVGTVVWRAENVNAGQGQPISQAVQADIDIPEVGLKLTMLFQKNQEAQFPASHTLDLRFTAAPNSAVGGVKQINVPQMRKDESPTGDPLVGLPVTITANYFLVGLSRGDAAAHNLDLIESRNWFDIPILMESGKVAKITFEKGATGQQIIKDVIASWQ